MREMKKVYEKGKLRVKVGPKVKEIEKKVEEVLVAFTKLPGISMERAKALYNAGFKSLRELWEAPPERLLAVKGIGLQVVRSLHHELENLYGKRPRGRMDRFLKISVDKGIRAGKRALDLTKYGISTARSKAVRTYKKVTKPLSKPPVSEEEVIQAFGKIPGVSAAKAKALYNAGFKSLSQLERTSLEELKKVSKVSEKLANRIKKELRG